MPYVCLSCSLLFQLGVGSEFPRRYGSCLLMQANISRLSLALSVDCTETNPLSQPVFVSCKIGQDLKVRKTKPQIVNQQHVVYRFQCDLCFAGYAGYTRGHLHTHVDGHNQKASLVYKHYHKQCSKVPTDLLRRFSIVKKC